ncbi:hypothetical protein MKZ02_22490 [Pseudobacillus sp. FSL P4-0506]|uniref:hypothetical protein n=1 Tax=unclassified Pseudobacillus TaxID=2619284 RepID=UPI0030FADF4F
MINALQDTLLLIWQQAKPMLLVVLIISIPAFVYVIYARQVKLIGFVLIGVYIGLLIALFVEVLKML